MTNDSRLSMVRSAAALIGSHGVSATSFSDVLATSGAPRGSIYHHFPDGKHQLAADAIGWTSDRVLAHLRSCAGTSPRDVLACFIELWRRSVVSSGGSSGCAVAGVALDTDRDNDLMGVVRQAFRSWQEMMANQLEVAGIDSDDARAIAVATLAGMEGALLLCRAEGNVRPLEIVASQLWKILPTDGHQTEQEDGSD